jgi:DNA invertase Pin-like site-specific DNA recombinase
MVRMPKRPVRRTRCTAIAYLRASKDERRLSRQAQRTSIEAWAMREGVRVAVWCTDQGVRSVSPIAERPGLRAALAAIREHRAGVLVVARRDRIARHVVLAAIVDRAVTIAGARLVSASGEGNGDSPADAFIRTVIDGAAQYEHGLIRVRTCAALAAKRARGETPHKSTLVPTPTGHQNGIDTENPQAEKEHVAPEWRTATPSTKHVHCGVSELLQLT